LSRASQQAISLTFRTEAGTALSNVDFSAQSGTVTIAAGQVSGSIRIPVLGDVLDEPSETFFVRLVSASQARIEDGEGRGTILDNDPRPVVSIGNVSVQEGNSGTRPAAFPVTLSAPSGFRVSVRFSTANGIARAGSDFVRKQGTVTFEPGETTKTVDISVRGDTFQENNETYYVALSAATNATLGNRRGTGVILDDDRPAAAASSANSAAAFGVEPSLAQERLSAAEAIAASSSISVGRASRATGVTWESVPRQNSRSGAGARNLAATSNRLLIERLAAEEVDWLFAMDWEILGPSAARIL
jgi:hypothetical protein